MGGSTAERTTSSRVPTRRIVIEAAIALVAIVLLLVAWRYDASWVERHASGMRCIRDPHTLRKAAVVRWLLVIVALILGLLIRPRVGRHVAKGPISFGAIARYSLAILLALPFAEFLLRRQTPPPPGTPVPVDYSPTHIGDMRYSWTFAPSTEHSYRMNGRDFMYSVNAEGNRARRIDANSDHSKPTIIVGGESIAMAIGLPYEQSFAALLEDDTGIQTVDLAVDAYGMDQAYLRELDTLPKYAHPVALVTVFVPDLAERADAEERSLLHPDSEGNLQLVPPTSETIRDIRIRRIFRDLYHGESAVEDMRAIARATATLARSHGAYPLFVTTNFMDPCLDVEGRSPWIFRTLFDEQDIPRVPVFIARDEQQSDDPHPGPVAHRHIADAVERALTDAHVLQIEH